MYKLNRKEFTTGEQVGHYGDELDNKIGFDNKDNYCIPLTLKEFQLLLEEDAKRKDVKGRLENMTLFGIDIGIIDSDKYDRK